jgi:hypothetical protein
MLFDSLVASRPFVRGGAVAGLVTNTHGYKRGIARCRRIFIYTVPIMYALGVTCIIRTVGHLFHAMRISLQSATNTSISIRYLLRLLLTWDEMSCNEE